MKTLTKYISLLEAVLSITVGGTVAEAALVFHHQFSRGEIIASPTNVQVSAPSRKPVKVVFQLRNVGNADVHIKDINTGCSCEGFATAEASGSTIHPAEDMKVIVTVYPGQGAFMTKNILVETDEKATQSHQVTLNIHFPSSHPTAKIAFKNERNSSNGTRR